MRLPLLCAPVAAALAASSLHARTAEDEQVWINATVMQTTASGFAWFAEAQPRLGEGAGRLQQLLVRPAVGWRINDAVTAYLGYAHVALPRRGEKDRNEDRLFVQLSWTIGDVGRGTLSSRTRLERRDLSTGRETGWRVRQMMRYVHPLGDPKRVRALVSAEPFVAFNDTDWGARSGFDQLRSFAGVEIPLEGKTTVELGYLNQFVNDAGGDRRVNHIAAASLFVRL
ncbi:MAG: DUF2490 domain-containing protein [Sphingomonas sp.]|nr:MAG: DUF2490 domain-containing protein [Sphingomonas sp.]